MQVGHHQATRTFFMPPNPSSSSGKPSASSFANAGVRLLKKLVYDNYEDSVKDRRGFDRQNVVGEASVSVTSPQGENLGDVAVFIRDSSRTGCGLWSRLEMPIGSTVMIKAVGPDGKSAGQRLGRVRHCRGASGSGFAVGVQFDGEAVPLGKAC